MLLTVLTSSIRGSPTSSHQSSLLKCQQVPANTHLNHIKKNRSKWSGHSSWENIPGVTNINKKVLPSSLTASSIALRHWIWSKSDYCKCTYMLQSYCKNILKKAHVHFFPLTSLTVHVFSTIMSISMPAEGAEPTEKCKKSCKAGEILTLVKHFPMLVTLICILSFFFF